MNLIKIKSRIVNLDAWKLISFYDDGVMFSDMSGGMEKAIIFSIDPKEASNKDTILNKEELEQLKHDLIEISYVSVP